jgi:cytochrome c peroxidase
MDPKGIIASYNVNGHINPRGALFQTLGINGPSCGTCRAPNQAMSISPPASREQFARTNGLDPPFIATDVATSTLKGTV